MSAVLSTVQSEASALLRRALELPRAGAVAGTLLALVLARALRAWYRLSHVPGPFWCGFSKYWMVRESLKGRQPYAIQEVIEEYGEAYSFCPLLSTTIAFLGHWESLTRWNGSPAAGRMTVGILN